MWMVKNSTIVVAMCARLVEVFIIFPLVTFTFYKKSVLRKTNQSKNNDVVLFVVAFSIQSCKMIK